MAMNKKEAAEMEELRRELRIARALRWPDTPPPEPMPVPKGSETVMGWVAYGSASAVDEAWSQSMRHGRGRDPEQSGSQRGIRLHRTKLDALLNLRAAKTREFAEHLASLDAQIEAERAASNTPAE